MVHQALNVAMAVCVGFLLRGQGRFVVFFEPSQAFIARVPPPFSTVEWDRIKAYQVSAALWVGTSLYKFTARRPHELGGSGSSIR